MSDGVKLADRLTQQMPTAGKRCPVGDRAEACLQEVERALTPPVVKKYHDSNRPMPGVIRVHHGKANDPKIADTIVHGKSVKSSLTAAASLNPPVCSRFQRKLQDFSEAIYASQRKTPLGRVPDQRLGLPGWYNDETTFGHRNVREVDVRDVIHPPKTAKELNNEIQGSHEAYVRSHNSYFVGERIDRKYDTDHYNKERCFGKPTPHCNEGRRVGRSLRWLDEPTGFYNPDRDSTGCVGKSQRKGGGLKVSPQHSFGLVKPEDEFGVGELMHCMDPDESVRPIERHRSLSGALRHRLKMINFQNFSSIVEAFRYYDKKGNGQVDKEDLQEVCRHFKLGVRDSVLGELLQYCDTYKNGFIDFLEFANYLTWKDKMPLNKNDQTLVVNALYPTSLDGDPASVLTRPPSSNALLKPEDLELFKRGSSNKNVRTIRRPDGTPNHYITSASFIGAGRGGLQSSKTRTYGLPSVRTDVSLTRNRRLSNLINYGDMTTAADLLVPSVYCSNGVYHDHFFSPCSKKEIAQVYRNVGEDISEETFEEAWKLASTRHPYGSVCVDSFQAALKEIKAL
ncbi:EF-hand domain-containing family member B [Nerophis ophidion]|uniref:EF-hand domain-containing family member B n=1 Tax=Nerophis ophidion TaxID=159077 RepID=UPI002ADF6EAD|nr:EF-hand domain-containing family member B [Nerophis ophidion]XP_061771452.1 EF-hand domain-containing family member B [Nerophis ophidion]